MQPRAAPAARRAPLPATGAGVPAALLACAAVACLAPAGCRSGTARRAPSRVDEQGSAHIASLRWRLPLSQPRPFEKLAGECATGAVAGSTLVLGSRAGRVVGVDLVKGRIIWSRPLGAGVDGEAVLHPGTGRVLVGADDGTLLALRPSDGAQIWAFRGEGSIEQAPSFDAARVYLATANDKLYTLDVHTGRQLWTYDRDKPEGFTIHGHSAAAVSEDLVFMGFSDGFLVALRADNGDLVWARSLALAATQYVDVDSTPVVAGELVIAASHSGGIYALARRDGQVRWRLPIEGASVQTLAEDRLHFYAPRGGLHAVDPKTGEIVWRNGLDRAGEITVPRVHGSLLLFSGTRAGLHIVDRESGQLLQVWNPGPGLCAGPALDEKRSMAYVLSNGGRLYALALAP